MAPNEYGAGFYYPDWFAEMQAGIRRAAYTAWVRFVCRPNLNPNPLTILTRALNGLWLRLRSIRQPCWKRGRWKSLT